MEGREMIEEVGGRLMDEWMGAWWMVDGGWWMSGWVNG